MLAIARPVLTFALCFAAGLAMPSHAAPSPKGGQLVPMTTVLKLTPAQTVKYDAMQRTHYRREQALKDAARQQQQTIVKLFTDPKVKDGDVQAAYNKLNALRSEILSSRGRHSVAVRGMLTPEQRKIFIEKNPNG